MLLSICMMVKNEEKFLDKCLIHLKQFMRNVDSELIIVDTGSTDNTVHIARKYTDKVYFYKWNNNFSDMRNITISYAKGKWIFIIDADEMLVRYKDMVKFLGSKYAEKYNSIFITVKNFTEKNDDSAYSTVSSPRLFKNDGKFKYEGAVHNEPLLKEPYAYVDGLIEHYGYIFSDEDFIERKFQRTANILKSELKKNPKNIYYWYQLSASYSMHGDKKEAIESSLRALHLMEEKVPKEQMINYIYVFTQMALSYLAVRDLKKVEYICNKAVEVGIEHIDVYYLLGKSRLLMGKDKDAIKSYEGYLEALDKYQNKDNNMVQTYYYGKKEYVFFDLFVLYKRIGKFKKSVEYFHKVKDKYILTNIESVEENISLYLDMDDYDGLKNFYDNVVIKYQIRDDFIEYLEKCINKNQVNIKKIKEILSEEDSYMILLNFRLAIQNNDDSLISDKETKNNVLELSLNELHYFYGDILYYYIKHSLHEFINLAKKISKQKNIEFFKYLDGKYEDFEELLHKTLYFNVEEDLNIVNLKKTIAKYLIAVTDNNIEHFKEIFSSYVNCGMAYIESIYNIKLLEDENIYCLEDEEEAFFLYMRKAYLVKFLEHKKYLHYLKMALNVYPYMNSGIKVLFDEFKQKQDIIEMEEYKKQIKQTIKIFIAENNIDDANKFINEYEKIVVGDPEIENIKKVMFS